MRLRAHQEVHALIAGVRQRKRVTRHWRELGFPGTSQLVVISSGMVDMMVTISEPEISMRGA